MYQWRHASGYSRVFRKNKSPIFKKRPSDYFPAATMVFTFKGSRCSKNAFWEIKKLPSTVVCEAIQTISFSKGFWLLHFTIDCMFTVVKHQDQLYNKCITGHSGITFAFIIYYDLLITD